MLTLLVISLAATDISIIEVGGFNLTLFWPMFLLALFTASYARGGIKSLEHNAFLLTCCVMLISIALTLDNSKPTSIALTAGLLLFGYWLLLQKGVISARQVYRAFTWVMVIYFVSTLLGALLVSSGKQESALSYVARSTYDLNAEVFRLQALSSEPSYAAIVVASVWLGLVRLYARDRSLVRGFWLLSAVALLMLFAFRSVYGIMLALLVLSTYLSILRGLRNRIIAFTIMAVGIIIFAQFDLAARVLQIAMGIATFDLDSWMAADGSSVMRVGPLLNYFSMFNITDHAFWLGHGAATSTNYFGKEFGYLAGFDVDKMQLGFLPAFMYDYGIIAFSIFIAFIWLLCRGPFCWQALILVLLMLFNANLNTQLFWFVLTCLYMSAPVLRSRRPVNWEAKN